MKAKSGERCSAARSSSGGAHLAPHSLRPAARAPVPESRCPRPAAHWCSAQAPCPPPPSRGGTLPSRVPAIAGSRVPRSGATPPDGRARGRWPRRMCPPVCARPCAALPPRSPGLPMCTPSELPFRVDRVTRVGCRAWRVPAGGSHCAPDERPRPPNSPRSPRPGPAAMCRGREWRHRPPARAARGAGGAPLGRVGASSRPPARSPPVPALPPAAEGLRPLSPRRPSRHAAAPRGAVEPLPPAALPGDGSRLGGGSCGRDAAPRRSDAAGGEERRARAGEGAAGGRYGRPRRSAEPGWGRRRPGRHGERGRAG